MKHLSIPYERRGERVEGFRVEYVVEDHSQDIGPVQNKWTAHVYTVSEKRGHQWRQVDQIDTSKHDIWGGALQSILQEIFDPLNDKEHYRWDEIKKPIIDYWHSKQESDRQQDIAAGGKGQWTSMGDYTLWRLMSFIASIFGIKWELLQQIPTASEQGFDSEDAFEKEMAVMAFDEVVVRNKFQEITQSHLDERSKAETAVIFLIEHSKKLPYSSRSYLLDPQYDDNVPLLSEEEDMELMALFQIYEEVERSIDSRAGVSKEEKRLLKYDFWETETGKRLNQLNSRRVHGGSLSFNKQEEKKLEVAKNISKLFLFLFGSWGFSVKDTQRKYMELYVRERWKREQRETSMRSVITKGKKQTEILRDILGGRWDSDSLSFFGIIVGIFVGIFFGIFSLLSSTVNIAINLVVCFGASLISIKIIVLIMSHYRKRILMWSQKILNPPDQPKKT